MVDLICAQCCYVGRPAKKKRGSRRMEFWGWMVFPLGLPYTLWRMLCKIPVCGECRHPTLIPLDSAVGQKLLAKFNEEMGVLPVKQVLPPMPVAVVPSGPRPVVDPEAW